MSTKLKNNSNSISYIATSIAMNMLGLGNGATPFSLKAMKSMQEENPNKEVASRSMITFIVINTASIQLIPTTIIAIRSSLGSSNPTAIIFPVWIATICAGITGIAVTKLLIKYCKKRERL